MEIIVTVILIAYNKKYSSFMKAFDVFEKGKVLGERIESEVVFNSEEMKFELEEFDSVPTIVRLAYENQGCMVSFVHVVSVECEDVVLKNTKCKIKPYINPEVRAISNGREWFMLHKFIKSLGIDVTVTEDCYIKEVK